ncbi:MAG: histidine phosphatase family protein [Oscillospiraceae bacterium]|nr:histidine phosphatase family protein [Oscillospiraceae bacterium]
MKTIITIQHTESVHHTNEMVGSWTDWELSENGKSQAKNIGKNLAAELSQKYTIYSSDLLRAKQTAETVGKYLNSSPIYKTELRERNLGEAVGKSVQWLRENMEKPERTVDDRLFPSAESRRDEWNRLKPFFDEITSNGEEHIIIVSHGDLLSVFNAMWLGLPVEFLEKAELFGVSGGVSFLFENSEGKRFIKKMSDTSYMKQEVTL